MREKLKFTRFDTILEKIKMDWIHDDAQYLDGVERKELDKIIKFRTIYRRPEIRRSRSCKGCNS